VPDSAVCKFYNSIERLISDITGLFVYKLKKELIINIYMLIKSVIMAGRQRLIVVILQITVNFENNLYMVNSKHVAE